MSRELKTLDSIMTIVCRYYLVEKRLVLSKKRDKEIVMARQMFCWLSRKYTRSTFKLIGEFINRNHATVLHSVRKVDDLVDFDREMKYDRDTIVDMNPQLNDVNGLIYNIQKVSIDDAYLYDTNGFSKVDTLRGVTYFELVRALGNPTESFLEEGDKSTCNWIVTFGDRVYTIYDWKTYDIEYTISELNTWMIGGAASSMDFKDMLTNLIDASLVSINK